MSSQLQPSLAGLTGMARRLVSEGVLPEADVRKAVADSAQQKASLAAWLLDHGLVESARLTQVASAEFGMPMIDVSSIAASSMPVNLISEALMTKHQALPLFKRGKRLFVGIADPMQSHALDEIKFHSNCMVEPILVERGQLARAIDGALAAVNATMPDMGSDEFDDLSLETADEDAADSTGIDATGGDDAPVVKFVNKILVDAIRRGASDIHFEPFETNFRVRLRMDGMLRPVANPPMKMASRISSRLKVMAGLDLAERRVPQDGRIKLNLSKSRSMDFRVSTLPTLFGEKIVLRILDSSSAKLGIDKLGYEEDQKKLYLDAIHKPYGMVLVTGPTGSGKTVSLYTALNILNTPERNISTVEDPVEIRVEGINQVQQNTKRGMTFAAALRSFLRQDPDVIMVGEIRDLETAEIAIKAAQTGHMVLSTLHTNDAPQTIARLMNMGIAPYNITSSVTLVIAQRLARRLHECKKPHNLPP
ncbi:MAG TPA: type IV-A pilus assembly ATPase PilB, partial [Frateuria sp.]|uniref:type IV-A pilus assembly ATPase PilB n=1 Tax=Frateuria sp. TaxID=2211372 RepID=UPI002D80A520